MAARNFQDLLCWQLSYELKCEVFAFTAKGPASRDFKYRDQIRDSAAAAPRDISEGFRRFRPRDFARFLEYARASLMETLTSLIDRPRRAPHHNTPDAVQAASSIHCGQANSPAEAILQYHGRRTRATPQTTGSLETRNNVTPARLERREHAAASEPSNTSQGKPPAFCRDHSEPCTI